MSLFYIIRLDEKLFSRACKCIVKVPVSNIDHLSRYNRVRLDQ